MSESTASVCEIDGRCGLHVIVGCDERRKLEQEAALLKKANDEVTKKFFEQKDEIRRLKDDLSEITIDRRAWAQLADERLQEMKRLSKELAEAKAQQERQAASTVCAVDNCAKAHGDLLYDIRYFADQALADLSSAQTRLHRISERCGPQASSNGG